MQPTRGDNASGHPIGNESLPLLAGAAVGVCGVGAVLALADIASPVRAPFTFFFLLAAPAAALAGALRSLDPLSRAVVAAGGTIVIDLLVAQGMLALHMWSVRGGVAVIAALSAALFLLPLLRRSLARAERRRTP